MTADRPGRRRALALVASAGAVSLAGCLGTVREFAGGDAGGTDGRGDVLRYETLDVGGSPGGERPLRPADRPVLLDFFATWCGPCRKQMETLGRIRGAFDADRLAMFSVSPESDEAAVRSFWTRHDGAWPVALDPQSTAIREYGVKGIPTLVVASPDGTVHWRHRGLAGVETMRREVRSVLDA